VNRTNKADDRELELPDSVEQGLKDKGLRIVGGQVLLPLENMNPQRAGCEYLNCLSSEQYCDYDFMAVHVIFSAVTMDNTLTIGGARPGGPRKQPDNEPGARRAPAALAVWDQRSQKVAACT
jgi:hypothetical protein